MDQHLISTKAGIFADLAALLSWGAWFIASYVLQHPGDAILFALALLLCALRIPTAYYDLRERMARHRKPPPP